MSCFDRVMRSGAVKSRSYMRAGSLIAQPYPCHIVQHRDSSRISSSLRSITPDLVLSIRRFGQTFDAQLYASVVPESTLLLHFLYSFDEAGTVQSRQHKTRSKSTLAKESVKTLLLLVRRQKLSVAQGEDHAKSISGLSNFASSNTCPATNSKQNRCRQKASGRVRNADEDMPTHRRSVMKPPRYHLGLSRKYRS
ncbi:hypothetical protein EJ03DRAFT_27659 [Teratosphaeria nubilosa]|uniref:Uncharacterized protein n=1 Tax=Teratosphaeria nubilosa TaxID=161662 RepID=A0A6G1KUZ7_9PEZI|nr:hypothetical protein EJ03DRAFT_27659 [Teratosphaeria nubilosa]